MTGDWRNRIVESGLVNPTDLEAHVLNWRRHPLAQRRALEAVLSEIGWVQSVVVNKRTGRLIDGHLRVAAAIDKGVDAIPVTYVDLDEDEERKALATFDSIAAGATTDDEALHALLASIEAGDEELARFLATLAGDDEDDVFAGAVVPTAPGDDDNTHTSGPASPAQSQRQLIFNVDADQRDEILEILSEVGEHYDLPPSEALVIICQEYRDSAAWLQAER